MFDAYLASSIVKKWALYFGNTFYLNFTTLLRFFSFFILQDKHLSYFFEYYTSQLFILS